MNYYKLKLLHISSILKYSPQIKIFYISGCCETSINLINILILSCEYIYYNIFVSLLNSELILIYVYKS